MPKPLPQPSQLARITGTKPWSSMWFPALQSECYCCAIMTGPIFPSFFLFGAISNRARSLSPFLIPQRTGRIIAGTGPDGVTELETDSLSSFILTEYDGSFSHQHYVISSSLPGDLRLSFWNSVIVGKHKSWVGVTACRYWEWKAEALLWETAVSSSEWSRDSAQRSSVLPSGVSSSQGHPVTGTESALELEMIQMTGCSVNYQPLC